MFYRTIIVVGVKKPNTISLTELHDTETLEIVISSHYISQEIEDEREGERERGGGREGGREGECSLFFVASTSARDY